MKFGLQLPNLGPFSDIHYLIQLAQEAETAGWDGFFLWDHVAIPQRMVDTMTVLTAIATVTSRIKLGPMITSPSRRRPWKLARELTTLDQLSDGRIILGVGLGESDYDFEHCGEVTSAKIRAQRLDEALTIMDGLWQGDNFSFQGEHFQVRDLHFQPTPIQHPRIPIWVAGWWDNKAPMRRAARWDGVFPLGKSDALSPLDWQNIISYIQGHRTSTVPLIKVHSGITANDRFTANQQVKPFAEVGVDWWLEDISPVRLGYKLGEEWVEPWEIEAIVERIQYGPPHI